uniref:ACB domain-containing protein n=1 Tax=Xiphophorus couchianus TaxID=32473 RepID=A0A3B5KSU9_9TELE
NHLKINFILYCDALKLDLCSYRPSYEVMLRFYSLYKQAVCGPCTMPRPGFWDPVGRYKWSVCHFIQNI